MLFNLIDEKFVYHFSPGLKPSGHGAIEEFHVSVTEPIIYIRRL